MNEAALPTLDEPAGAVRNPARRLPSALGAFLEGKNHRREAYLEAEEEAISFALRRAGAEHPVRFRHFLLQAILTAGGAFSRLDARTAALRYCRDALIRHLVLRAGLGPAKVKSILVRLAAQAAAWPPPQLLHLRGLVERESELADDEASYRSAVARLSALAQEKEPRLDPQASTALESLLLRLLDEAGRAVGLRRLEQAFALHVLLTSLGAPRLGHCPLLPEALHEGEEQVDEALEIFDFENLYRWQGLTAATGAEGRRWLDTYESAVTPLAGALRQALLLLRQKRLADGEALLHAARADLEALRAENPSQGEVMARFFYGAWSYLCFCRGLIAEAEAALTLAEKEVGAAVARHDFLIAFAAVALDIPLKRARLARDLGRWDDCCRHLQEARAMLGDERPLLEAGTRRLFFRDIAGRFAGLAEDEQLGPCLRFLREPARRRRLFLHFAGMLCRPPGLLPEP